MEAKIKYFISEDVKNLAKSLNVKIFQGLYGPVFVGSEDSIEKIKDFYLGSLSINSLGQEEKKHRLFDKAGVGPLSHAVVSNEIMGRDDEYSERDEVGLRDERERRQKEQQRQKEELEKQENEKRRQAKIKEEKTMLALYEAARLSQNGIALAHEAKNAYIAKNKKIIFVQDVCTDEAIITKNCGILNLIADYNERTISNDSYIVALSDNTKELNNEIKNLHDKESDNDGTNAKRNHTNPVVLHSSQSLDEYITESKSLEKEELDAKYDAIRADIDGMDELERVLPNLKI